MLDATLADITDDDQARIKQAFADGAGVSTDWVSLRLESASVLATATISAEEEAALAAAMESLAPQLASATAATTFLSSAGVTYAVTADPVVTRLEPVTYVTPELGSDQGSGSTVMALSSDGGGDNDEAALIGGVVGGVCGFLLLVCCIVGLMKCKSVGGGGMTLAFLSRGSFSLGRGDVKASKASKSYIQQVSMYNASGLRGDTNRPTNMRSSGSNMRASGSNMRASGSGGSYEFGGGKISLRDPSLSARSSHGHNHSFSENV